MQNETNVTKTNKDTNDKMIVHVSCLQQQAKLAESWKKLGKKVAKTWQNSVRKYL